MSTDTLAHADIFFYVTTIVVVVFGAAIALVAYYAVRALEQARRALKEVEEHVGDASEDLKGMLFDIRESAAYRFLFRKKRKKING